MALLNILHWFANPLASIPTLLWVIVLIVVLRRIWKGGGSDIYKIFWTLIVCFFPVIGVIIWWFVNN